MSHITALSWECVINVLTQQKRNVWDCHLSEPKRTMTVPAASVANASPAKERGLNPKYCLNFEVTIPGLGCRIAIELSNLNLNYTVACTIRHNQAIHSTFQSLRDFQANDLGVGHFGDRFTDSDLPFKRK